MYGLLEKRFNSYAFHAYIHGFESRTGHHFLLLMIFYIGYHQGWRENSLFLMEWQVFKVLEYKSAEN